MSDYELDEDGIRMLLGFEGFILHPYRDVAGIETVCVGHVVRPEDRVWLKDGVTRAECEAVLGRDTSRFVAALNRLVKVKLSQPMVRALCSLIFNIGIGDEKHGFTGSTVLRELNWGNYTAAADAFLLWRYAKVKQKDGSYVKKPVLLGRRQAEAALFRSGIMEAHGYGKSEPKPLEELLEMAQASMFDLRWSLDDRGLPVEDTDFVTADGRLYALPPDEEETAVVLT